MTTDDAIINPFKPKNEADIGSVAVMAAIRADLFLLCDLLQFKRNDYKRLFISRMYSGCNRSEGFSVTGPFIGAPYAVMLLETAAESGDGLFQQ